jgi:hypothetical protein
MYIYINPLSPWTMKTTSITTSIKNHLYYENHLENHLYVPPSIIFFIFGT